MKEMIIKVTARFQVCYCEDDFDGPWPTDEKLEKSAIVHVEDQYLSSDGREDLSLVMGAEIV